MSSCVDFPVFFFYVRLYFSFVSTAGFFSNSVGYLTIAENGVFFFVPFLKPNYLSAQNVRMTH